MAMPAAAIFPPGGQAATIAGDVTGVTPRSASKRARQRNTVLRSTPSLNAASSTDKRLGAWVSVNVRATISARDRAAAQTGSPTTGTLIPFASV